LLDIVTFNGQKKTIENSSAPVRNADGGIVGALIINEDVTEKIRAEELLQARQQEIRAIVENSPDFIARYDLEMRRTYVNPAFSKAHGVPREQLLGREVGTKPTDSLDNVAPEELIILKKSLQWVREHRLPMNLELTWPLSMGPRDFAVHLEPEFDVRGVFMSILAISRDVTELKAAEKRLREMEAELARVSRLTTMGELAVAIAHETNQPLSAVATNAEACLNWLDAEPPNFGEVREALRRIVRDGTRAGEVITRIRSLLKKGAPVRSALDIRDVVEETLGFIQADLERNKVRVKTELQANLPKVHADRVQVQQVLLNLLTNAIDALKGVPAAARDLCLRAIRDEPASVEVTVKDSGAGIDPAEAVHLFDAFFTTKPHGLGMGLAISRSIIEAHSGRLWATPNDGPGASFHFTLPVDRG
jgi:PAS domain S-box-containing protein